MKQLVLASASPRRKQILIDRGFKFKIAPSNIDERAYENLDPVEMVKILSLLKAKAAARKYKNSIILGSDTTVVVKGEMLSKPKSKENAKEMINKLSDTIHEVITGFSIIDLENDKTITSHDITKITFRKVGNKEIIDYLNKAEYMDKAGAYAIQAEGGEFVKKIDGDYLNVVGLPSKVFEYLKEFGLK